MEGALEARSAQPHLQYLTSAVEWESDLIQSRSFGKEPNGFLNWSDTHVYKSPT